MKARYVQRGESIDYTPEADVAAGDIVKVGNLVGVAKLDIKAGELISPSPQGCREAGGYAGCALALVGVYEIATRISPCEAARRGR